MFTMLYFKPSYKGNVIFILLNLIMIWVDNGDIVDNDFSLL